MKKVIIILAVIALNAGSSQANDKWTLFKIHAPNQEIENQIRDSLRSTIIKLETETMIVNDKYKAPIRFYKIPFKDFFRDESTKELYQQILRNEYKIIVNDRDILEYFEINSANVGYPFNELMMEGNSAIKIGDYLFFKYMFEPVSFKKTNYSGK